MLGYWTSFSVNCLLICFLHFPIDFPSFSHWFLRTLYIWEILSPPRAYAILGQPSVFLVNGPCYKNYVVDSSGSKFILLGRGQPAGDSALGHAENLNLLIEHPELTWGTWLNSSVSSSNKLLQNWKKIQKNTQKHQPLENSHWSETCHRYT